MTLDLINFGKFENQHLEIRTLAIPNGCGKTTLLNAYLFALTGKCVDGFVPRRVGAPDHETTQVTLHEFDGLTIRRALGAKGTTLYLNGDVVTQTEFTGMLADRGIDLALVVAMADSNVLTSDALTSEGLRKILTTLDYLDNGEATEKRKLQKQLRAELKEAEKYAVTTVVIPQATMMELTTCENMWIMQWRKAEQVKEPTTTCECCGQTLPQDKLATLRATYNSAQGLLNSPEAQEEFKRISEKLAAFEEEQERIARATVVVNGAKRARARKVELQGQLETLDKELQILDAEAVQKVLPTGLEIVTTSTTQRGTTKSVCTLTWNSIPLKSVNRAKRITLMLDLLSQARRNKNMEHIPIIVDNAEAVQSLDYYDNVIGLYVG